jgi:small GTP-binding protein
MSTTQLAPPPPEIKVVVVGDGAVGKTCLCNVFVTREFPLTYEPTIFENYTQKMTINGKVGSNMTSHITYLSLFLTVKVSHGTLT